MPKTKKSISLCMIVKNEAQTLDNCLYSINNLVDEIIITDTGSTDKTLDIAEKYSTKISQIPWPNDFSAARNHSISQATGDYILILDADETISKKDIDRIKNLIPQDDTAFSFPTRNYLKINDIPDCIPCTGDYPEEEKGYFGWVKSDKIRLFPARNGVKFENKIHEIVEPSILKANIPIQQTDIPIHHFGYSKEADYQKEKAAMHLHILKDQVKITPNNPKFHYDLGFILFKQDKYKEALPYLEEALNIKPDYMDALFFKTKILLKLGLLGEAEYSATALIQKSPNNAECYHLLGDIMLSSNDTTEALRNYKKAEKLSPSHPQICIKISDILQKANMPEKAKLFLEKAKTALEKL